MLYWRTGNDSRHVNVGERMFDNLEGAVTGVADRAVRGWVRDKSFPSRIPRLWVKVNGLRAGEIGIDCYQVKAGRRRSEIQAHSFSFPIDPYFDFVDHIEVFFDENMSVPLSFSSDFEICEKSNRPPDPGVRRETPPSWLPGANCEYPSFFLLGAGKSGTTSLHHYLRQHRDVCMSVPKEPYYFETEYVKGPQFYFNRYFPHWKGEPVVGDARQRHLYLPFAPARIFAHNPRAKLVAILRNPVERLVSDWWHWRSRGMEELDLGDAFRADLDRIDAGLGYHSAEEQAAYEATLAEDGKGMYRVYVDSGYYAEQLQRYIDLFGRERLHLAWFEDLVADPWTVTAELLDFLGVDPEPADEFEYPHLNWRKSGMPEKIPDGLVQSIVEHFKPHNRVLERLTGRSLEHWDSPTF
ncbi:sulfotransferase domain-containing protein [Amycolatopsis vastitatis]|uniref:Sulfotransferase domain-containing protein n=1 Tax=Amycolatopsis vastitatis TaxID=1905142 RepID=A0A229SKY2_9PSEU|nr:sulfotransferase domain-containing protein [Amycolatopsis vastitatis]OXM59496.1 hypothetical protein CF165_47250 [Amycolatopsis vastitatis]